jgi:hypothetical protein
MVRNASIQCKNNTQNSLQDVRSWFFFLLGLAFGPILSRSLSNLTLTFICSFMILYCMHVLFGPFFQLDISIGMGCGYVWIKEVTSYRHMIWRDWTTSSFYIDYTTFNIQHNWEDLCIHLKNQHTCTSNKHIKMRGGMMFNLLLMDVS